MLSRPSLPKAVGWLTKMSELNGNHPPLSGFVRCRKLRRSRNGTDWIVANPAG
jgi:hypothetical protein